MATSKTIKVYTKKGKAVLIDAAEENSPKYSHLKKIKPVKTKRTPKKTVDSNTNIQVESENNDTDS